MQDLSVAAEAFDGLEPLHVEMITHPLGRGSLDLSQALRMCGSRLNHMHMQVRSRQAKGGPARLAQDAGFVRERVGQLIDGGYEGSFTIEFTQGVTKVPEENADIDTLFRHAVEDMEVLRG